MSSNKNRTRHAQQQYIDFMKDAGCDLNEIEEQLRVRPQKNGVLKRTIYKQVDVNGELAYPAQRHRKIQKQPKVDQRGKEIGKYSDSATGNFLSSSSEQAELQLIKNGSIPSLKPNESRIHPVSVQQPSQLLALPQIKQFQFHQCVNKSGNNFYGYFGHSTILVTKPVIEGSYYMEVNILDPFHPPHPKGRKFQSFVRVGICKSDQRLLVPLGGQNSYCYKGKDGLLLHNSATIEQAQGEPYTDGDTIGMLLQFSPPKRNTKENNLKGMINEGSRLSFYKNGIKTCEVRDIQQHFYHFGVSLFNWANVNINLGPKFKYEPGEMVEYKPIKAVFEEKILYQDLKL